MQQFLKTLWIDYGLSKEEIKKAYYKKSLSLHPDRQNWDEQAMMILNGAYDFIMENFESYTNKTLENTFKQTANYFYSEWLYIFYVWKDYELALSKFQKTIELNSKHNTAFYLQWLCLYKLWNIIDALIILKKFQRENQKHSWVYNVIIEILEKRWDKEWAREYEKLLKKNTPQKKKNHGELLRELSATYAKKEMSEKQVFKNYSQRNKPSTTNIDFDTIGNILFIVWIIIFFYFFPESWHYLIDIGAKLRTFTDNIFFNSLK